MNLPVFMCIDLSVGMATGSALEKIGVGMWIGMDVGVGALFEFASE